MLISSSLSGIIKLIVIHAIHIWVCLCQRLSVSQQLREISLKKGGGQRIRVHLWIKLINHYWHWDKFKRGALKCTPLKWTLHLGIGDMVSISNFSPNFPDNAAHNWSLTALFKKTKQNPVLDTRFFVWGSIIIILRTSSKYTCPSAVSQSPTKMLNFHPFGNHTSLLPIWVGCFQ